MGQSVRTFVAVEAGEAVRRRAAELIDALRPVASTVKWVDPQQLHMTLKFLGDVPLRRTAAVCEAVAAAVASRPCFSLGVRGLGAFPHVRRPSTLWLGADPGDGQIVALQAAVEAALAELGFRPEGRSFSPHLTLGRVRRGGPTPPALLERLGEQEAFDAGVIEVRETVVLASQLTPTGPVYTPMGRLPLGGLTP